MDKNKKYSFLELSYESNIYVFLFTIGTLLLFAPITTYVSAIITLHIDSRIFLYFLLILLFFYFGFTEVIFLLLRKYQPKSILEKTVTLVPILVLISSFQGIDIIDKSLPKVWDTFYLYQEGVSGFIIYLALIGYSFGFWLQGFILPKIIFEESEIVVKKVFRIGHFLMGILPWPLLSIAVLDLTLNIPLNIWIYKNDLLFAIFYFISGTMISCVWITLVFPHIFSIIKFENNFDAIRVLRSLFKEPKKKDALSKIVKKPKDIEKLLGIMIRRNYIVQKRNYFYLNKDKFS